jgi:hypothetical protein
MMRGRRCAVVVREDPEFARCTLSVLHLAKIDVQSLGEASDRTSLEVVIELARGWSAAAVSELLARSKAPRGATIRPQRCFPDTRRVVLGATVPTRDAAVAATRLVAWTVSRLSLLHEGK